MNGIEEFAKQGEAAKLKFIYCIREAALQDEKTALSDEISPYEICSAMVRWAGAILKVAPPRAIKDFKLIMLLFSMFIYLHKIF